jgi:hypothetical protein
MDGVEKSLIKLLGNKKNKEQYFLAWLHKEWEFLCGGAAARRLLPEKVRNDVLFVAAATASWAHNFLTMKEEFIRKINEEKAGIIKIRDIKTSVKNLEAAAAATDEEPARRAEPWPELSAGEKKQLTKTARLLNDSALRKTLYRILCLLERRKKLFAARGYSSCACGVQLYYRTDKCPVCRKEENRRTRLRVAALLRQVPWLTWQEARECVPVDKEDFFQVKEEYERVFLRRALDKRARKADILDYVMLKNNCPIERLTDELVNSTMEKARRLFRAPAP